MFLWWLVKRMAKPVVELWNDDFMPGMIRSCLVGLSFIPALIVDVFITVLFDNKPSDNHMWLVVSWLLMAVWSCFGAWHLAGYIIRMHTEYRAEQPEKPKRKRTTVQPIEDELHTWLGFEEGCNSANEYIDKLFYRDGE